MIILHQDFFVIFSDTDVLTSDSELEYLLKSITVFFSFNM